MFYVFVHLIEDETDDTGTKINCNPTGNPRCNQATWKRYNGYNDGCCSPEEKCSINEGDCNSHEDCAGSLVCTPNSCPSSKDPEIKAKFKFKELASCCQMPSGEYIYGIKQKVGYIYILILNHNTSILNDSCELLPNCFRI